MNTMTREESNIDETKRFVSPVLFSSLFLVLIHDSRESKANTTEILEPGIRNGSLVLEIY